MEIEDEYPAQVRAIVKMIRDDRGVAKAKWYANPEGMAADMRYPSHHNQQVYDLLDSAEAAYLGYKAPKLVSAQRLLQHKQEAAKQQQAKAAREEVKQKERKAHKEAEQREWEAREEAKQKDRETREEIKQAAIEAKQKEREDRKQAAIEAKKQHAEQRQMETMEALQQELGGVPLDEVDFVNLLVAKYGWNMTFDRQYANGQRDRLTAEQITLDTHLTAAKLNLVKPRGDLLGATNIDRALAQWALTQRKQCVTRVLQRIAGLPDDVADVDVFAEHERLCGLYYDEDPRYAAAVERKVLWQIQRMLHDLPVEHRVMLVMVGPQGSGKTYRQRMITDPIRELVAEASLKDVLDERQMELCSYGALLLDELVSADKADVAALKNFVTGADWARRPMRSNLIEKVRVRASLMGTSNHSLGRLIYDSTGMRRFVELRVKARPAIEPHWQAIIGFPWLHLWQAVDVAGEDPLMQDFADVLQARQEEIRTADNTELWAMQLDTREVHNVKSRNTGWIEFYAQDLYVNFRAYEQEFDRGWRGTNVTRWGLDLKSLIDADKLPGWSYRKVSAKTVYRLPHTQTETDDNPLSKISRLHSIR